MTKKLEITTEYLVLQIIEDMLGTQRDAILFRTGDKKEALDKSAEYRIFDRQATVWVAARTEIVINKGEPDYDRNFIEH